MKRKVTDYLNEVITLLGTEHRHQTFHGNEGKELMYFYEKEDSGFSMRLDFYTVDNHFQFKYRVVNDSHNFMFIDLFELETDLDVYFNSLMKSLNKEIDKLEILN